MIISCSSLFLWEYNTPEIIEIVKEAGIEHIEFWTETPEFWKKRFDDTYIALLTENLSLLNNGYNLHAPILDLNPSSYNDFVHEITIRETLWCLDFADRIGAGIVTIHPGYRTVHRKPTEEDRDKMTRYLEICTTHAKKLGITLALENRMPKISSICANPDEMQKIMDSFSGLMMTFDIAHALFTSSDLALDFIDKLFDRIVNVHVGALHNGIHAPAHLVHGTGLEAILNSLKDKGYSGYLTIEIDDKAYGKPLSRAEKIKELVNEKNYLESIFE